MHRILEINSKENQNVTRSYDKFGVGDLDGR
jgi:hypothetical protein